MRRAPGIALSRAQMVQLTSDIVCLVEQDAALTGPARGPREAAALTADWIKKFVVGGVWK